MRVCFMRYRRTLSENVKLNVTMLSMKKNDINMSQNNSGNVHSFRAGKQSIDKTLNLLKTERAKKRKHHPDDTDKYEKMAKYCTSTVSMKKKRGNSCTVGFSQSFGITQMRSCVARHDWMNVKKLIPLLLDNSIDKEPLLWRFALLIFLKSAKIDDNLLHRFLESCIGSISETETTELNEFLQQLLTLRNSGREIHDMKYPVDQDSVFMEIEEL